MSSEFFANLLKKGPVILDGATGTNLQKAGMPTGVCPELWISEHPDVMQDLQRRYVEAGSQIVYAPTFTANRIKLEEYGLGNRLEELNRTMVRISREAVDGKALVAGDLTMTGKQLYPVGDLPFEELVDVYKEQVCAILKEGVDLFVVETMMSLQECRAALLAIKETCDLPVMISLTFNEDGRTLFGSRPDTCMIVLENMGADCVGLNCSTGPEDMVPLVKQMAEYANVPIIAKPNAGMPELDETGETIYRMTPEEFAGDMKLLMDAGASVVGGCCGTTPEHIKALAAMAKGREVPAPKKERASVITSERANCTIDLNGPFLVVGERINPTGKKKLQAELRTNSMDMVRTFARQQEEDGAAILDINMGTNGIDEKQMMINAINEVAYTVDLPLCIDSSYIEVLEAGLRIYPGRALINSISAEDERLDALLPLAKKYGAMFIGLPVGDNGLPKDQEEKRANIRHILDRAAEYGLGKEDAVIDILVATIGADPTSAISCFEAIDYCKNELGVPTICGLSNISFGMPQRTFVNTAFLNIALSRGLTMAIANPSQEMLMYTALANDMLMMKPGASEKYLERVPQGTVSVTTKDKKQATAAATTEPAHDPVYDCILNGDKANISAEVQKMLDAGKDPSTIINDYMIPAINEVGKLYNDKKYFLPQLIAGADAMEIGMSILEPLMVNDSAEQKETIIIATVEGDIHDIGKNLVALMLKNYGYNVIDLGKDVPAEEIVDQAVANNASVIALSALMTTTMMRMKEVVELVHARNLPQKVIIGGAATTPSFADEIGADGYSEDAAGCVVLVEKLLGDQA